VLGVIDDADELALAGLDDLLDRVHVVGDEVADDRSRDPKVDEVGGQIVDCLRPWKEARVRQEPPGCGQVVLADPGSFGFGRVAHFGRIPSWHASDTTAPTPDTRRTCKFVIHSNEGSCDDARSRQRAPRSRQGVALDRDLPFTVERNRPRGARRRGSRSRERDGVASDANRA